MSSSHVAPIRVLTGQLSLAPSLPALLLIALLSACARTPPPESASATPTTPGEIPAAVQPSTAVLQTPAQRPGQVILPFSADDARIGTEIGARGLGSGMSTTGKEGWLMFGPYDSATPHQQMPQVGSRRAASLNERIASW